MKFLIITLFMPCIILSAASSSTGNNRSSKGSIVTSSSKKLSKKHLQSKSTTEIPEIDSPSRSSLPVAIPMGHARKRSNSGFDFPTENPWGSPPFESVSPTSSTWVSPTISDSKMSKKTSIGPSAAIHRPHLTSADLTAIQTVVYQTLRSHDRSVQEVTDQLSKEQSSDSTHTDLAKIYVHMDAVYSQLTQIIAQQEKIMNKLIKSNARLQAAVGQLDGIPRLHLEAETLSAEIQEAVQMTAKAASQSTSVSARIGELSDKHDKYAHRHETVSLNILAELKTLAEQSAKTVGDLTHIIHSLSTKELSESMSPRSSVDGPRNSLSPEGERRTRSSMAFLRSLSGTKE